MRPNITVGHVSHVAELKARIKEVGKRAVYVGIPEATAHDRANQLSTLGGKQVKLSKKGKLVTGKKFGRLAAVHAFNDVSNAQLLWIFSKGSPLRKQDARPVLEPAVEADGNKQAIAAELAAATRAALAGKQGGVTKYLKRAGLAGQNAARSWFTDPRNGWKANAASTIAAKGSDRPGIDTGAMRAAITYVVDAKT